MKIILISLFSILTICSCSSSENKTPDTTTEGTPTQNKGKSFTVRPGVFKEKMVNEPGTILDVRTPEEVALGTIPNAVVIDFNSPEFESKVNQLDKTKPVYVYCKAGGRSSKATDVMLKNGFTLVYNLEGGITAWMEEGYNTVLP